MEQQTKKTEPQTKKVKKRRYLSTDIDFEISSPVFKAVLTALLALLLVTVAVYQIYALTKTRKTLPTETALLSTVYRNITADAVALRSESVLPRTTSGTVVPMASNGSKVAVNDTVARVYSNPADAERASAFSRIEEEIDYYESIAALSAGNLVAGIDMYNRNVGNRLLDMLNCVSSGELTGFPDAVMEFSESVTKKQIAIGVNVDAGAKLQSLYSAMNDLNGISSGYTSVTAPEAGFYVNSSDGCEDMCDVSAIMSINCAGVDNLLNYTPVQQGSEVGKLITAFNWYIVCAVDEQDADGLEVGDNVKITVDALGGETLTMKLKAKNRAEDSRVALVFSSNIMNSRLALLRFSQIKIRVDEYEGYSVNKKAVRTVDGEVGVYIQLGNLIRFRKIDIIYSDDNIILAAASAQDGYLKLYDEIITEGVENNDGKIII